jgi:hypothetical protein
MENAVAIPTRCDPLGELELPGRVDEELRGVDTLRYRVESGD